MSDDLRPADHVDGARVGSVVEEFDIRDGLRHLERVLLLLALLLILWELKHHQYRVAQILQTSNRLIYTQIAPRTDCVKGNLVIKSLLLIQ